MHNMNPKRIALVIAEKMKPSKEDSDKEYSKSDELHELFVDLRKAIETKNDLEGCEALEAFVQYVQSQPEKEDSEDDSDSEEDSKSY